MNAPHDRLPQEPDHVSTLAVLTLVIIGLLLLTAGLVWPWKILLGLREQYAQFNFGQASRVAEPEEELGGLLQSPIEELAARPAPEPRTTYRWIDRQRGLLEMPVEDAMALWLARNGAPAVDGVAAVEPTPGPAAFSEEGGTR